MKVRPHLKKFCSAHFCFFFRQWRCVLRSLAHGCFTVTSPITSRLAWRPCTRSQRKVKGVHKILYINVVHCGEAKCVLCLFFSKEKRVFWLNCWGKTSSQCEWLKCFYILDPNCQHLYNGIVEYFFIQLQIK